MFGFDGMLASARRKWKQNPMRALEVSDGNFKCWLVSDEMMQELIRLSAATGMQLRERAMQ